MLDSFGNPIPAETPPEVPAETPAAPESPAAPEGVAAPEGAAAPAEAPVPEGPDATPPRITVLGGAGATEADLLLLFPDAAVRAAVTADMTAAGTLRPGPGSRTCLDC